jgi:tetratricopeptide (TPR) repeat protein
MRNGRLIIQRWADQFRASVISAAFDYDFEVESSIESKSNGYRSGKFSSRTTTEKLDNVTRQKDAIKALIDKGDIAKALDYTRQLVDNQKRDSEPQHIAMSLCDLAQHSKDRYNFKLQLELSTWAAAECPLDPWSQAQIADAYRQLGDFDKAMEHYEKAGQFGDRSIALNGRAEVLKDSGDVNGCLSVYENCVALFPSDVVAKNGQAAALAYFGRLDQSLNLYDIILKQFPGDKATRCGKAQVLRDMGRYNEAMQILDNLLEQEGFEEYPANIKAGIQRELGNLGYAQDLYNTVVRRRPYSLVAQIGLAHTLKDLGNFNEALQCYDQIAEKFPHDPSGMMGKASTFKLQSRITEAIAIYDDVIRSFPSFLAARNGNSALRATLGE